MQVFGLKVWSCCQVAAVEHLGSELRHGYGVLLGHPVGHHLGGEVRSTDRTVTHLAAQGTPG